MHFDSIEVHLEVNMASRNIPGQRMAFGLAELSSDTGISVGLLRKEIKRGALRIRRIGRRVVVLREDWVHYLEQAVGRNERPERI